MFAFVGLIVTQNLGEAAEHRPANQIENLTPSLPDFGPEGITKMERKGVEECVFRKIKMLGSHAVT